MTPILRDPTPRPRRPLLVPLLVAAAAVAAVFFTPHTPGPTRSSATTSATARVTLPVGPADDPRTLRQTTISEKHSIDRAQVGSTNILLANGPGSLSVPRGVPLTVYGWAVDVGARRPSSSVYATLGDVVLHARGHLDRADVAIALGNPAYLGSGFALDIATADLPLGRNSLAFHAVAASGKTRYDIGAPIALDVTAP